MIRLKRYFTVVAGLLLSGYAFGQCVPTDTNIYFGNGVGVDDLAMGANIEAIEDLVLSDLKSLYPSQEFEVLGAYNHTRGQIRDVAEVYRQRTLGTGWPPLTSDQIIELQKLPRERIEEVALKLSALETTTSGTETSMNIFRDFDPLDQIEVMREVFTSQLVELHEQVDNLELDLELLATNEELTSLYREDLARGARVVIVPHSQGNLFALASGERLQTEDPDVIDHLGVVGVATPGDRTFNGGPYWTAHDDRVIDGIRLHFFVLPSNIENDLTFTGMSDDRDFTNHFFVRSYLGENLPSRDRIRADLISFAESLIHDTVDTPLTQPECDALLDLYTSTDGPNWEFNDGWNTNTDPCTWLGITCIVQSDGSLDMEIRLTTTVVGNSLVIGNNLNGVIPPSIGDLENLTRLNLSSNEFLLGHIPASIGKLSKLEYLELGDTGISGSIPPELGDISSLKLINFQSMGALSGSIPAELGKLANLENLFLTHTNVSGSIPPELGMLSNLLSLILVGNELSGSLPEELANLNVSELNVTENQLGGPLPASFSPTGTIGLLFLHTGINETNDCFIPANQAQIDWINPVNSPTWSC